MKKIEEKMTIEQTNVWYEAADGTRFYEKDECETYEKSAKCAIRAAVCDIATLDTDGYTLCGCGSEDQQVYVVTPETDDDLKALRTYEAMIRQKYEDTFSTRILPEHKGQALLIVVGYDEDWIDVRKVDDIVKMLTGK